MPSNELTHVPEVDAFVEQTVKTKFEAAVYDNAEQHFHAPSTTHIYYCAPLAKLELKGYGNFPNEAFGNFKKALKALVEDAPTEVLKRWLSELEIYAKKKRIEENLAAIARKQKAAAGARKKVWASQKFIAGIKAPKNKICQAVAHTLEVNTSQLFRDVILAENESSKEKLAHVGPIGNVRLRMDHSGVTYYVRLSPEVRAMHEMMSDKLDMTEADVRNNILALTPILRRKLSRR